MQSMTMIVAGVAWASIAGGAPAQTAPPGQGAPTAPPEAVSPGEDWHPFSHNTDRVYLADVGTIQTADDVTTLRVARVKRRPTSPTDRGYTIDEYAFRCAAGQVRLGAAIEFGPDGAETDRYEDGGDWEAIRDGTLDAYAKPLACDGARANPPSWPSIRAYMDAGRGGGG